jgi:formylmethanofuran dehydrogenase subunit C
VTDAITLTPKAAFPGLVDGRALAPDRLAGLTGSQLGKLLLPVEGRGSVPLGDLCRIDGDTSQKLRLEGDWSAVDGLGTGMAGGRLEVTGSAGRDVGACMVGGVVIVQGDAGANAGGARPGGSRGMAGGEIVIRGGAGSEAGARMRRGLIYVGGAAGEGAGRSMIAGTLVLAGPAGQNTALWNKRGSIIALADLAIPVTYRYACSYHPPAVPLLLGRLARLYGARIGPEQIAGRYRRYSGDLAESGKGEILAWMAA